VIFDFLGVVRGFSWGGGAELEFEPPPQPASIRRTAKIHACLIERTARGECGIAM
jgi:hypothetical protein